MLKKNKDFNKRVNFLKFEIKLYLLKFFFYNKDCSAYEKYIIVNLLVYYHKLKLSRTLFKNKSILSKENSSVNRIFKISRWELKQLASVGDSVVSGLKKSSW